MRKANKVNLEIEIVGPHGQDFRIKTYKLDGVYYLETSQVINGIHTGYKTQWHSSKIGMIEARNLAYDYLKFKGIW